MNTHTFFHIAKIFSQSTTYCCQSTTPLITVLHFQLTWSKKCHHSPMMKNSLKIVTTSQVIIIHVCVSAHMVLIRDLLSALWPVGDSGNISQESLKQRLQQLFQGVLQNLPVQVVPKATEQTARLLFKLYDR